MKLALAKQNPLSYDGLRAFHFGRSVGRVEAARNAALMRVRWLLFGGAVGLAFAAAYIEIALHSGIFNVLR